MTAHQAHKRPRVVPGLLRFTEADSYVFEGAVDTAVFSGPGATDLLPRLCDLLDGTRTLADVAGTLRLSIADVVAAASLLSSHGLLAHTPHPTPSEAVPPTESVLAPPATAQSAAFLTRLSGYSGRASDPADTPGTVVLGQGELAGLLRDGLAASGQRVLDGTADLAAPAPVGRLAGLVINVHEPGGSREDGLLARCGRLGLMWLGVGATLDGGFVGPMAHPTLSCAVCTQAWSARQTVAAPSDPAIRLLAGLALAEAVHALTGVADVRTVNQVRRITVANGSGGPPLAHAYERVYCTGHRAASHPADPIGANAVPWRYEQEIERVLPEFFVSYRPASGPVSDASAPETGARQLLTCPAADREKLAAEDAPGLATVLETLRWSVGGATEARRPVPSAGGLASQQAFVVSRDPLPLLDTHTAWYDGRSDELRATARVSAEAVAGSLGAQLPADDTWRYAVVWLGDVSRLAPKYGNLSVRLAHLDAGAAMVQALLVAQAMGQLPRVLARWDAGLLADLIGLDTARETVTGVLLFGGEDR
jgi:SagB-type dehydrogenase family enzyme